MAQGGAPIGAPTNKQSSLISAGADGEIRTCEVQTNLNGRLAQVDLSGRWRTAPLAPELSRSGADPELDDSDWATTQVPGHWGQEAAFSESEGPILYRRKFQADRPDGNRRSWLVFEGVLSESEVWLDGVYLGDTVGYFLPHRFEVTEQLAKPPSTEHLLAVEVACPGGSSNRSFTGSIRNGPLAPPGSPGGIWRPVSLFDTGPVSIKWARLLCSKADKHLAELTVRIVLDANEATEVRIDTSITGPNDNAVGGGAETRQVSSGENQISWTIPIENPELWWPTALGEQPRYEVAVAVKTNDGALCDRRHWRTGLRRVELDNLRWKINGERMFIKGIDVGPASRFLGAVEPQRLSNDLRTVKSAGFNLVRLRSHINRPELYDAADDAGILLWQDLPIVGKLPRTARKAARGIARGAVDALGHHPAVAVWSVHDEPNGPPIAPPGTTDETLSSTSQRFLRHLLPSWNRSVFGPTIKRQLRTDDGTRAVIAHSGSLPGPVDMTGSDSHLWLGWHFGRASDLPDLVKRWPRLGAFPGGVGAQSAVIADWPKNAPQWATAQVGSFDRYVPRRAYANGKSWAQATQTYQAEVLRTQIETIRKLKYSPAGGFTISALADPEPGGGFGILDHHRQPKAAYDSVVDANRPVIVVAEPPPQVVVPGQELKLAVHAISDLRSDLETVQVTATITSGDWSRERVWEGALPMDSCVLVGHIVETVPVAAGTLTIDLELQTEKRVASNRYQTVVIAPSESIGRVPR